MERYNVSDIKRMIRESIDEVRSLNFGTNPNQSVNISTQGQQPIATAPSHSKIQTKWPMPQYAYFEEMNGEYKLVVRLNGIHAQHQDELVQKWNKDYGSFMTAIIKGADKTGEKNAAAPIELIINPDNEDDFKNIVPNIAKDIAEKNGKGDKRNKGIPGFYEDRAIKELPTKIISVVESAPTKEEIENAEARKVSNIEALLSKINDPNIISKISKITGNVNYQPVALVNGITPANQLSLGNKLEVYSQLPNATFVTNAWTWINKYNRTINNLNEFAIIKKPTNNKPKDLRAWNKAAEMNGYIDKTGKLTPYDFFNALRKNGDLSQAQIFRVLAVANIFTPTTTDFISEKVYDVSNTTLIPGMADIWNETVDFKDNLNGFANDVALKTDIKAKAEADNIAADAKITIPQEVMSKTTDELIEIINTIKTLCARDCGTMPNAINGTLGDQIFHLSKFWAEHTINLTANKPSIREAIFNTFGLCVARIFGADTDKGNNIQKNFMDVSKNNGMDLKGAISETFRDLKKFILLVQSDLNKKSNQMIKAGLKTSKTQKGASNISTTTPSDTSLQKKVMEESICEDIFPISFDEFLETAKECGVPIEDENNNIQIDDVVSQQELQESFFRFLDKMDKIF